MSLRRLVLTLLALLTLAPLAGAHGPYEATIRQNETHLYVVDHSGPLCLQVFTRWTVTLTYTPVTDTLTLIVPDRGADVGQNGSATVSFTTSTSCAFFEILVHGTLVADEADYVVEVTTAPGGPLVEW